VSVIASPPNGVRDALLGVGSGHKGMAQFAKSTRVFDVFGIWLVVFEASGQLLGLVDDLVNSSWHRSPQILRSGFHCMDHDRALVGAHDADLVKIAGTIGSDEHRHSLVEVLDEYRVVEGMEKGLITDTVLSRTVHDSWLYHKLPCLTEYCKITCDITRLIR
jgi:hypothetical protein